MTQENAPDPLSVPDGAKQPSSSRKRFWIRLIVYVALAAALGLIVWRVYRNQQQNAAAVASQAAALENQPVPVQVTPAEARPMPIFLTALGTVTPYMSVTVKARVSGTLEPVKFTEGQQVRKGQTIMVIDPRPYRAALDQAKGTLAHDQALLKNAQAQFKRYKALYAAGVVSKETVDSDEAAQGQYQGAIEADQAAVETARLQLGWCYIQSPIDGKIGLRLVDPGNIITANTTSLIIINQLQPIAVYFTLPQNQLPPVLRRLAAEKRLVVEAYDQSNTQKLASGLLLTADNQIDTTTGTGKLKAVFDNREQALYPNQFVNIHLIMEQRPNALVVPSAAIQTGNKGLYVWVIDTDPVTKTSRARMQSVQVALSEGEITILDGGLAPGQQVVVDGADRLRSGQVVITSMARPQSKQNTGQSVGAQDFVQRNSGQPVAPQAASSQAMRPGKPAGVPSGNNSRRDRRSR